MPVATLEGITISLQYYYYESRYFIIGEIIALSGTAHIFQSEIVYNKVLGHPVKNSNFV